jgi:flavin-dependent dehydrogenase
MDAEPEVDFLIAGAGPAGMTAALVALFGVSSAGLFERHRSSRFECSAT